MADPVLDISHWQDKVDLGEVKRQGVLGIIHKATEGHSNVDDRYKGRKVEAANEGLLWGAYHFLRPGDMKAQAAHFVRVAGKEVDVLAADHEDPGVSLSDLKVFLKEVSKLTGKEQLVIYSGHVLKEQLSGHDEELAKHRLWLAQYTTGTPTWEKATWPEWWLWQYTDKGKCVGVNGNVDCNRYEGTPEELATEWTGEAPDDGDDGKVPTVEIEVTVVGVAPENVHVTVKGG